MNWLFVGILLFFQTARAQQQSGNNLSPIEMAQLQGAMVEMDANKKPQVTPPPTAPTPTQSAQTAPVPTQGAPVPPAPPPPPTAPPVQVMPALNPNTFQAPGTLSNTEFDPTGMKRNKSPFMIPTELYLKIKKKQGAKQAPDAGQIDTTVEVRRRWPLKDYNLVGVLWNVKHPKALISDKETKVHTFRLKEFIGNAGGYISEIANGEVIVVERGAEIKLKLKEK